MKKTLLEKLTRTVHIFIELFSLIMVIGLLYENRNSIECKIALVFYLIVFIISTYLLVSSIKDEKGGK